MAYEAEMPGMMLSAEQLQMIYLRYHTAGKFVQGKQVLEVGCGAGLGLGYLAKRAKRVVGGDCAENNVRCARQHYKRRIELLLLDAHSLPFQDNCFDVIVAMEVIFYLRHVDRFLDECSRVLKRGGRLIICLPNKNMPGFFKSELSYRYYSVPELYSLLNGHGFDAEVLGAFPILGSGAGQRLQSTMRRKVSKILDMMPGGRRIRGILDKSIFHKAPLKEELEDEDMKILGNIQLAPLPCNSSNSRYKILYAVAQARGSRVHSDKWS